MFAAAAVCPSPPVLVPEVAGGAAPELDTLRAACDGAVSAVLDAGPDTVVVVGDAPRTGALPRDACGSLRPYGVDISVSLNGSAGRTVLPLPHTIGAWLLARSGWPGRRTAYGVAADTSPEECRRLGAALAASAGSVGLLVMGDGTARRSEKAPGYLDPDAAGFDRRVAQALADVDSGALLDLDPQAARRLLAAGRAAWQVLAGAAEGSGCSGSLRYDDAPYGVGYLVAVWR